MTVQEMTLRDSTGTQHEDNSGSMKAEQDRSFTQQCDLAVQNESLRHYVEVVGWDGNEGRGGTQW